ncbi:DegV family protein [bacterium]|nr:DegV family protein [bacterium]
MKNVAILVCNFASFTDDIIDKYNIIPISSNLYWPEMDSLVGENIFQKMRDALKKGLNSNPKTSQPSMGTFKKYFEEALSKNDELICITISSKISGTYNSALQTKKMFNEDSQKKIHIIDSNNIDVAETLLAIKAREIIEQESDINSAIQKIESFIPKLYFYGMTENSAQMEAGGRINHLLAVLLEQMQRMGMRPILHMENGEVKAANLKMNARDTASALFRQFEDVNKSELINKKNFMIAISHADNINEAEELRDLFENKYPNQVKVFFTSMTGIFIGSHVGPGTLMCCTLQEN